MNLLRVARPFGSNKAITILNLILQPSHPEITFAIIYHVLRCLHNLICNVSLIASVHVRETHQSYNSIGSWASQRFQHRSDLEATHNGKRIQTMMSQNQTSWDGFR
jgi:hypothetical protein